MEAQYSASNGGVDGVNWRAKDVVVAKKGGVRSCDLALRVLALVLTLVASIVIGIDKQNTTVQITLGSSLPPVSVPVTAKMHYLSAFVYSTAANAIAATYAAISLILTLTRRSGKKNLTMIVILFDLAMAALLFSSNGASVAIGVIGYQGNSHVQWNKVCHMLDKFCLQLAAGLVVSLLGSVVYLLLILLAALHLNNKRN